MKHITFGRLPKEQNDSLTIRQTLTSSSGNFDNDEIEIERINAKKVADEIMDENKKLTPIDDDTTIIARNDEPARGQWTGQFDFLMSMIAYAVGLGNVWRFPYLCFKNGGGSFLIVYAIFWGLGAVPIFLMEVTVGQYLQLGGIEAWNICPIFKGVGLGNCVIAAMCISYYCIIITWSIHYMINSLRSVFPWETCDNWWNNPITCITGKENASEIIRIGAQLAQINRTSESSVEQYWEFSDPRNGSFPATGAVTHFPYYGAFLRYGVNNIACSYFD